MSSEYTNLGFIGLGAMGKPMAEQLAIKLPATAKITVYDVIESSIAELVDKYPGKVIAGSSPRYVAENSVCPKNTMLVPQISGTCH